MISLPPAMKHRTMHARQKIKGYKVIFGGKLNFLRPTLTNEHSTWISVKIPILSLELIVYV